MRRTLVIFALTLMGLYLALHLALGSSPVQQRVLSEIQKILSKYGLVLNIESIEFSALSPRIYLNRVTISATKDSEIPLPEPLAIDKIKIQFQPLALIYRRILIEEATLFHPRIVVPNAEKLVKRIERLIKKNKPVEMQGGSVSLVIEKFGVVDALFNVVSKDPPISVRSRSLSAFVTRSASGQQTITVESPNLELERQGIRLNLTRTDIDIDLAPKSLRVNRAIIEADNKLAINIRGTASLPLKEEKLTDTFSAVYDVQVPLTMLNQIKEIGLEDEIRGLLQSSGTLKKEGNAYVGNGNVHYDNVVFDDFKFGVGGFQFKVSDRKLSLSDLNVKYGGGEVRSGGVSVDLRDHFPISGELNIKDLRLDGLLDHLDQPDIPLRMVSSGNVKLGGQLQKPFNLVGSVKMKGRNFALVDDNEKDAVPGNVILGVEEADVEGTLTFTPDRMLIAAGIDALGGKLTGEGFVDYHKIAKIKVRGEGTSLTQFARIAELKLGGKANLFAEIDVAGTDVKVAGAFDVTDGEIQDLVIGPIKGQAYFQNALLTFENLETTALEPVKANGFVDFKPDDIHYRFNIAARRANVDQIMGIFRKDPLTIPIPSGGEIGGRVVLEGGHDKAGIFVNASGQAKNFDFYNERWVSANYDIVYRPAFIELPRVMLFKKSGGVEATGRFEKTGKNRLTLKSQGLRLEELDQVSKAPLTGEVVGDVTLLGNFSQFPPQADGEVRLVKMAFRGNPVADSGIRMRAEGKGVEFVANAAGEKFRGRFLKNIDDKSKSELLLYFREFDFTWLTTLVLGRDLQPLTDLTATGDVSLKGDFSSWQGLKGNGSITDVTLGLKGTPMKNKVPLSVVVDGGFIKVNRFNLVGNESQISLDLLYQPGKTIESSIDGKMDLQFVQPFIPGLDYGSGKVSAGIRVSGKPDTFDMLGNVTLEDGVFRLTGMSDEFRSVQAQFGVSQNRVNVDRFDAVMNGGTVVVEGDVGIKRFTTLIPNLKINVNRVTMKTQNYLTTTLSGDLFLTGTEVPYLLGGKCRIAQARLTSFGPSTSKPPVENEKAPLRFDIGCEAKDKIFVQTDVMDAEFKVNLQLVGDTNEIGLLGTAESLRGSLFFKDTKFTLSDGVVRFEGQRKIAPRFSVSATTRKKEEIAQEEYDVNLQVFGTPTDYRIRLSSSPPLGEGDIIALLLMGVTGKSAPAYTDKGYLGLATTIAGQSPIQQKIQSALGVDVKFGTQPGVATPAGNTNPQAAGSATSGDQVANVKIQKEITKKTKLSYSNSLDLGSASPTREFKIEHALDDNFTINGTALDRSRGSTATQSNQAYGLDFRYRFSFE